MSEQANFFGDDKPSALERVRTELALLNQRIRFLENDVQEKHKENRRDNEEMRSSISTLTKEIGAMKLKIAGYAGGAGVITALALAIFQTILRKIF